VGVSKRWESKVGGASDLCRWPENDKDVKGQSPGAVCSRHLGSAPLHLRLHDGALQYSRSQSGPLSEVGDL